jgi:hypothetical protein
MLIFMSLVVDHLELVGVKQTWKWWRGERGEKGNQRETQTTTAVVRTASSPEEEKNYETQQVYSHMRHPTLLPFVIVLWITPHLTLDRILLAVWFTAYLLTAHSLTHNDLQYIEYQLLYTFKNWVEDLNPFAFRTTSSSIR